jgi:alpha-glucosidase
MAFVTSIDRQPWWKTAVFYQIYPRSFADTNGDGVGDLEGIRTNLEHLAWLGVDAVWVSPFYTSPMADFGYDVSDYCNVDPLFGTLADFDRLLADAHDRGIRIIVDWVPNHSSDQHPWFVESRSSRDNPKRDWYVWRDGTPDKPPNNWRRSWSKLPAWTWDEHTEAWYLHMFLPQQPDLNWTNPEVVEAMHGTLRFWLDRGVDGFRIDVAHLIGKGNELPDFGRDVESQRRLNFDDGCHRLIRDFRRLLDTYDNERMMVGEVYILDTARVARYTNDVLLHLAFNFPPLWAPWTAEAWREQLDTTYSALAGGWPTWTLSNHDHVRHRTRFGSEAAARAAAVLLLTQRGTPFLYAGEELGLEDAVIPESRVVDPGGRDGCRAPIPWDASPGHGWPAEPWLPWPPATERNNAAVLREDESSVLHLYRRLLTARSASAALREGAFDWLPSPDGVLAYERVSGNDRRAVIVNFSDTEAAVPLDGDWIIEIASEGADGLPYHGTVAGSGALLLKPA